MSKLWGGKTKRIEVYSRETKQVISTFEADDAVSVSPYNTFYKDGEEVNWYDERKCYYKSFEIE